MTHHTGGKLRPFFRRRQEPDRRAAARVRPAGGTLCLVRPPGCPPDEAAVWDLSAEGLALLASHPYPLGDVLPLLLVNAAHTCALAAELRVARCLDGPGGRFLVAGEFTRPFRHEDLLPFLA
jgi:hypothetical protein